MARRRPPRAGRERSAAAHPGPVDGTRDHPPVRRPRFGGDPVVGEGAGMGPPTPHVRLFRSAAPRTRSGPHPRLPGPRGRRPHRRTPLPPRGRRPPARGFENRYLLDSPEGYIPGRNLIFYGLAGYYAELDAVQYIIGGHNGIDPESFPDSSPKFFNFLNSVFHLSLWSYDKSPVKILVPLSGKSKEDVIRMGLAMDVPFEVTWSCYWDKAVHCGICVSCRERREAFAQVGIEDPVEYEAPLGQSPGRSDPQGRPLSQKG